MELQIEEREDGTLIETGSEVAVVVQGSEGERIFLPDVSGSDSTYYVEEGVSGKEFFYPGKVSDVEVIR